MNSIWIILFAPLAACALITVFTRRQPNLSAALSIGAVVLGFVLSICLFRELIAGHPIPAPSVEWLSMGAVRIELGSVVDRLSVLMLLVVTGVGSAIHVFSLAYMKGDPGFARYFACMSLFTFAMLGVVLSNNFIQMFIFWELVGVASYLLIGFWFERDSAAEAGKKAFLVNRIGDFGFMLGILMVGSIAGTFNFSELETVWPTVQASGVQLTIAAGLIFCGAIGKSAQIPLHVWLPDAMEGPTPVSALIHAATMVAAGVYMLCRVAFLVQGSATALAIIAWIGGVTAIMAALVAITQNDIKRVLAYSTLSQLGYMVMAVGLGGTVESMFHLTTHAFFKALLFLAAGSVIMALHHEQDIWKMGGLRKQMPVTFWTFLIGTLALSGVWPLSGFYSKDEILLLAAEKSPALMYIGAATALLTAFYMGRVLFVVFFGRPRGYEARESSAVATIPLALLAVLSVIAGWGNKIPGFLQPEHHVAAHSGVLTIAFVVIPFVGLLVAAAMYGREPAGDVKLRRTLGPVYEIISQKFYFDEVYLWLVKYVQGSVAALCQLIDVWILQRLVDFGITRTARTFSETARRTQTGNVRAYAFVSAIGMSIILYIALLK